MAILVGHREERVIEHVDIPGHPRMNVTNQLDGQFGLVEHAGIHLTLSGLSKVEALVHFGLAVHVVHERVGILDVHGLSDHGCGDHRLINAADLINQRLARRSGVGLAGRKTRLDVDSHIGQSVIGTHDVGAGHNRLGVQSTAQLVTLDRGDFPSRGNFAGNLDFTGDLACESAGSCNRRHHRDNLQCVFHFVFLVRPQIRWDANPRELWVKRLREIFHKLSPPTIHGVRYSKSGQQAPGLEQIKWDWTGWLRNTFENSVVSFEYGNHRATTALGPS